MRGLFVDTSAWIALVEKRHALRERVTALLQGFPGRLYTSNFVLNETVTLCQVRHDHAAARALGSHILDSPDLQLLRLSGQDERRSWELFLDRKDKAYSYTDCTSFVMMRRLNIERAVALDDDFRREGFEVLPAS